MVEEDVTVGMTTTTTRCAYDGWNPAKAGATGTSGYDVWAVFNSLGSLTSRQLQGDGIDQHLAYVTSSNANWYLTDHLGSTRAAIDDSGTVQDSLAYDAYGNITYQTPSPSAAPLYTYTGREVDVETGLQYNRARWYDPNTGRWISQDPMGFDAGDSNLYRYVNNRPIIAIDPSGLLEVDDRPNQRMNAKLVNVGPMIQRIINTYLDRIAEKAKRDALAPRQFVDLVYEYLGADEPGTGVRPLRSNSWLTEVSMVAKIAYLLGRSLSERDHQIARIPFDQSRYHRVPLATWSNRANVLSDMSVSGVLGEELWSGGTFVFGPLAVIAREGAVLGDVAAGTVRVGVMKSVPPAFFSISTANHMLSPTVKIGDVVIGLDKLEHFFQQGYWLYVGAYRGQEVLKTEELRTKFNEWMEGINNNATGI